MKDLQKLTIKVDIKLDYGNGTVVWHNDTRIPMNASLLIATVKIAETAYSVSDFGAFVTSINGVEGDSKHFWLWSYFDKEKREWVFGPVGCDRWMLRDGDALAWAYTAF